MKFNTVRGMRDLLPEQAAKKEWIVDVCREVFRKYAFQPLETPIVEEFELLAKKGGAGDEIKNELYYFKDKSERELGLRFDLTVPLARFIASNPNIPKPFKRYQIGTAYRYDRPQAGRYREFSQADVDIVGTASMLAELEIIGVAAEVMKELGLKATIKINNRQVLEEIALRNGVKKAQIVDCFRCLDKLEKIGKQGVEKELEEKGIRAQILGQLLGKKIEELPDCNGKTQLSELFGLLVETGISGNTVLDLSLTRGLEYYTGTVFEVSAGRMTVAGGGRYDNLIALYGGNATPAVGISFGVDRLIDVVPEKAGEKESKGVFIVPVGKTEKQAAVLAATIRNAGIRCEIDLMGRSISKNLDFAGKKGYRLAIIVGENELKEKSVSLRDMKTGEQKRVSLNAIASEIKKLD